MRTIALVFCLVAVTVPCQAAPKIKGNSNDASLAQTCRAIVGKEESEGTDGKSHLGQLNMQRFSDCLMGH
jgi:hypothetical protein